MAREEINFLNRLYINIARWLDLLAWSDAVASTDLPRFWIIADSKTIDAYILENVSDCILDVIQDATFL